MLERLYSRKNILIVIFALIILTCIGCASVSRALDDYRIAVGDPTISAEVSGVQNSVLAILSTFFPEFKTANSGIAFTISFVVSFLSGLVLGRKKRRS